jgi:hypothetical protein
MRLTETEKLKIEEEERFREKVRKDINRVPWWKPKGIGAWLFTIFIIFPIFAWILASIISGGSSTQQSTKQLSNAVFDIPSLVDKDIDGVIAVLGTPKGKDPTAQQIELGINEWDKTFVKDGKELLVTYTISNRKIIDFFIPTDDPSGLTTDTEHLLRLGNLKQGDPRYRIEFVKAIKDPSSFTGVKVIPLI